MKVLPIRIMTLLAALAVLPSFSGAWAQSEPTRRVNPQPRGPVGRGRGAADGVAWVNPNPGPSRGEGSSDRRLGENQRSMSPMLRVSRVDLYPGTRIIVPPAWPRCMVLPTFAYWRHRDLMTEIQGLSRRGFLPVTPMGDSVDTLTDYVQVPAGWRAYGISVPAGGTVQVEVQHDKLGWFRLMLVDRWGQPGPGMMQAAMTPQPVLVTYRNPGKEATAIYVIVDDPAWWSNAKDPYTLRLRRDWDPAKTDLSQVKMVAGLWGASPSVSAEFSGPSVTGPAVYPH